MFVPCRHEHGSGLEKQAKFDHIIYSVNSSYGQSVADVRKKLGPPENILEGPSTPEELFQDAPLQGLVGDIECFRRHPMKGLFDNNDLFLSIQIGGSSIESPKLAELEEKSAPSKDVKPKSPRKSKQEKQTPKPPAQKKKTEGTKQSERLKRKNEADGDQPKKKVKK